MKQIVFSVFDTKAECYLPPFTFPAIGQGVRMFVDICTDDSHPVGKHYADYRLCRIGEFDDTEGVLTSGPPIVLATGDEARGSREAR